MKNYYVYLKPENDEPYRFVTGISRRWLFWTKLEYSWLPTVAMVDDYLELAHLQLLASKETGREVVAVESYEMEHRHKDNLYWAVIKKGKGEPQWFTGLTMRDKRTGKGEPETTNDIFRCQLFVREQFAIDQMLDLKRKGQDAAVVAVYVNTRNVFFEPCILVVCVNKERGTTRYLKSYKDGERRLRYAQWPNEALMIDIEDVVPLYDKLASQHKELSFTMIVRPEAEIPASKLREHENELVQQIAVNYYIGKKEKRK